MKELALGIFVFLIFCVGVPIGIMFVVENTSELFRPTIQEAYQLLLATVGILSFACGCVGSLAIMFSAEF